MEEVKEENRVNNLSNSIRLFRRIVINFGPRPAL